MKNSTLQRTGSAGSGKRLADAPRELPHLDRAVDALELPVGFAIRDVDAVAREARVEHVQPRQVLDHEALQAPLGRRSVVEVDGQEGLPATGLQGVPPLRASRHVRSVEVAPAVYARRRSGGRFRRRLTSTGIAHDVGRPSGVLPSTPKRSPDRRHITTANAWPERPVGSRADCSLRLKERRGFVSSGSFPRCR